MNFYSQITVFLIPNIFNEQEQDTYVAAYEFRPEEEGELYFKRGDSILVLDKEDANWWKGRNVATGSEGLFPATYVQKKS